MERLEAPNPAEQAWLEQSLREAIELARRVGAPEEPPTPEVLDRVWDGPGAALRASGADPNGFLNAIGAALGQLLAGERGLVWTVVADELGTEIAVVCPTSDARVFPMSLVAKRWVAGGPVHFAQLVPRISADIEILQTAAGMFDG